MELDPVESLAFVLRANPGAYALLLGSGVSRSSVPSGWDVLRALVEQMAAMKGVGPEGALDWYRSTFDAEPAYDVVLGKLTQTASERVGLLTPFFEPSADQPGDKMPTAAHHAIAGLVRDGIMKVILTTNFDRLMERALEQVGVTPTVLATPDSMESARPLHQQKACIIKLHGDYLDPRFLNTGDELASYADAVNHFLGRVLDDYGIIVCGWSAAWDPALRSALEGHRSRRYGSYWVEPSDPGKHAARLISLQDMVVVKDTADAFFDRLSENLASLAEIQRPRPASVALAVESVKRYLREGDEIRFHDLVARELRDARRGIGDWPFGGIAAEYQALVDRIDGASEMAAALICTAAYWGNAATDAVWVPSLIEWASPPGMGGTTAFLDLRYYGATMLLYSAGAAMMAKGRVRDLETLLRRTVRNHVSGKPAPLSSELLASRSLTWLRAPGRLDATSHHVKERLQPVFREFLLLSDAAFDKAFDRLELLLYLVTADHRSDERFDAANLSTGVISTEGPIFAIRAAPVVDLERESVVGIHPWISEGLFGGVADRLAERLREFESYFAAVRGGL